MAIKIRGIASRTLILKSACHVDEFRVFFLFGSRGFWLEGHSAYGTVPRSVPDDLRMHGTGPFGFGQWGQRRNGLKRHTALGAGARSLPSHLGVHGTGIDFGLIQGPGSSLSSFRSNECFRILFKGFFARFGTEVICYSSIL